mmetsp:Transcript_33315/g.98262  ORF Transcript_33315/g.98262 Transcript_33315/m.98262 type:complete len:221 (+) Transcript_33315:199-861(+)
MSTIYLEPKVLKDALAVNGLLGEESSGGNHGKAAVVELLVLHLEEIIGVLGHEAEGVETEVAGDVVGLELTRLVDGGVDGVHPALLEAECLGGTDDGDEQGPEEGRDLSDVGDGRSGDLRVEEEAGSLHLLADDEADGGEHCNSAVSELGLAVSVHEGIVGTLGKAQGIKVHIGGETAGKLADVDGIEGGGGLGGLSRSEGSGRSDESEGGKKELHCCCC